MDLLQLTNVNVYLPDREAPVLQHMTMGINHREWIALVGKNGSGKSVLGKLLAGIEGRYTGELRRITGERTAGWIMQNPEAQIIGETVWEDVCFGLENQGLPPEQIRMKATAALHKTGLSGLENRSVRQLSGGQKQLLAIAGVIALEPALLVADEATSMLDPAARRRVLCVLQELQRGGTAILYITQLLEELAYAGRVIALENGSIGYDGSKENFFYGQPGKEGTPCGRLGLIPPYTVRTAQELIRLGISLQGYPISPEELAEAVLAP